MKVLMINTLYYPNGTGGAEKNTQMISEGLSAQGIDVVVVTTSDRDYVDYVNGIKVYYVKTRNLYWGFGSKHQKKYKKPLWHLIDAYNPMMAERIGEIICAERPDIAQTNCLSGFSVAVWPLLKRYGLPILHILNDHYLLCLKTTMFSDNRNCISQCRLCKTFAIPKKKLSGLVDSVAGVSKYILDRHTDNGYFKNARYKTWLPNFVDIGHNKPKKLKDRLSFGFVGLLSAGKGIELVLEQFEYLKEVDLTIFGRGESAEYEDYLKKRFKSDNIQFKGYNPNHAEVFSSFDVLVIPSLWNEAAGRVVIEAYSYGLPVIASNRGGIQDYVEDGKTGLVFNPDISGSLMEKIQWFLQNSGNYNGISADCIEKVHGFSRDRIISEFINMYSVLLEST